MKTREEILEVLEIVARGLKNLSASTVFVGGCTVPLHMDPDANISVRPTQDVDCVVEAATWLQYSKLEEELRRLGFKEYVGAHAPRCRRLYRDIIVDVMPSEDTLMGFSNRWYKEGVLHSVSYALPSGCQIQIFGFPYFLLSKLEAVKDRGKELRNSKDLEDIVSVMMGRKNFESDLSVLPVKIRKEVGRAFQKITEAPHFKEGVYAHLSPSQTEDAMNIILTMEKLAKFSS